MAEQKQFTVIHKKSNQALEGGVPKLPDGGKLEYGEIAINYKKGLETISFKNDNGEVVAFQNEVFIGDALPEGNGTIEIFIDESVEPAEVEVYTKAEIDTNINTLTTKDTDLERQIEAKIVAGNETTNSEAFILIDENASDNAEMVYTKKEVDALIAKLKADNNLV